MNLQFLESYSQAGKFKIGVKVKVVRSYEGNWNKGLIGEVVAYREDGHLGVSFNKKEIPEKVSPHNLKGHLKENTGWWFPLNGASSYLEIIEDQLEFEF